MVPLALPRIALLSIVLTSSVGIELLSSSARVTSVKSAKRLFETPGPIDRTPGTHGSDKKTPCLLPNQQLWVWGQAVSDKLRLWKVYQSQCIVALPVEVIS